MNADEWRIIASGNERIIRFRSQPGFIEFQTITWPTPTAAVRIDTTKLRTEHWNKILVCLKEDRLAEENRLAGKFEDPPTKEETKS